MKYYLDENLSQRIAKLGRARGIDVVTSLEAGGETGPDYLHLAAAAGLGRCLVTRDRDYVRLSRQFGSEAKQHCGVLLIYRSLSDDPAIVAKVLSYYSDLFPGGVDPYTVVTANPALLS